MVNPERMVIAEARRTYTYLSLFGYHVDAVIANRLLPDAVADPWFARWKALHAEHLAAIEEGFAPLPVLRRRCSPRSWSASTPCGPSPTPSTATRTRRPVRVERAHRACAAAGRRTVLEVDLPFTDRDELELGRRDGELLVRVGPYRRALLLPDSLRRRSVAGARLSDGQLLVTFAAAAGGLTREGTSMEPDTTCPDRARDGLQHLQAAARELILAARALLDVVEDLVDDPAALATLVGAVGSLGDIARRAPTPPDGNAGDDGAESGTVIQRITVA